MRDHTGRSARRKRWLEATGALVRAYGAALEAAAATKSIVVDQDRLPAPKDKIKTALLVALHTIRDPHMREQLKISYLELSTFQPGVGNAPVGSIFSQSLDPSGR